MKKIAIIIGATGATGKIILKKLLKDKRYKKIKLFSRSSCGIQHVKIEEYLIDLLELEQHSKNFIANEVYCCIGTTKKLTPEPVIYKKIDFGIPLTAAELAKKNGIPTFLVVSSLGANANSSTFYTKTKGEMENAINQLKIQKTFIFRPSLLLRATKESRIFETIAGKVMIITSFLFVGSLKKYRAIKTENLAKVMILLANSKEKSKILESDKIQFISDHCEI
ncbi:NAD(P)H-binding protein [Flavicella sp.]|uniref:NAD(P)H-binding protein n=1 Tax=Flavicella sp. TaxID=2957742 RepID=UPI003019F196